MCLFVTLIVTDFRGVTCGITITAGSAAKQSSSKKGNLDYSIYYQLSVNESPVITGTAVPKQADRQTKIAKKIILICTVYTHIFIEYTAFNKKLLL